MRQPRPQPPSLGRTSNHLPHDIVLNILAKLPVKSVLRFRCVCKSWNSSIITPYFISTHLSNINNNIKDNDNGYVIHIGSNPSSSSSTRRVCAVALDRTFERVSEFEIPSDLHPWFDGLLGSCNGLLCFADSDGVLYLCNPIIRKFKKLPHTCLGNFDCVTLGFAYHSENNDYKVVKISNTPLSAPEIEVYSLSSDSWRRVKFLLSAFNVRFYVVLPVPLVSGALHWMAHITEGEEDHRSDLIMAFDVNSEKFSKLALPDGCIEANISVWFLASFKGKLAVITFERVNEQPGFQGQYSIWVMKDYGVVESWNKLFVVPFERVVSCLAFTEYGSLVVFYIKEQVERLGFKHALVDTESLHEKDLDIQDPSFVVTFMESLILLDGVNVASF